MKTNDVVKPCWVFGVGLVGDGGGEGGREGGTGGALPKLMTKKKKKKRRELLFMVCCLGGTLFKPPFNPI